MPNRRRVTAVAVLLAGGCLAATVPARADSTAPPAAAFPPGLRLTAAFPYGLTQAEPSVQVDNTGQVYVIAPGSTPIGCELWTLPAGARSATFHTPPDLGVGGGDCDLALTPPAVAGGHQTVAYSSLSLANITVGSSTDGGATFSTANPVASQIPLTDRQWMASDGSTIYLSYHLVTSNTIAVSASTDGGKTYLVRGSAIDSAHLLQAAYNNELGPIVVDRHSTASPKPLYTIFVAPSDAVANAASAAGTTTANANGIYLAQSFDGGYSWTDTPIYIAPAGSSEDRIFPALAVDAGGGLWASWSDGAQIYLARTVNRPATGPRDVDSTTSTTSGTSLLTTTTSTATTTVSTLDDIPQVDSVTPLTWTAPVVASAAGSRANVYPWLVGGKSRRADLVYYTGTGAGNNDPANVWDVAFSQLVATPANALSETSQIASDHHIHAGAICTTGVTCPGTSRTLLDFFQVALSPDGRAALAWADDSQSAGVAQIYATEQCAGVSATTGQTLPSTC